MNDKDIGTKALKTYYSHMKGLYPFTFRYTEAQFFELIAKIKGGKNLADGLGGGIREAEMSDSKVSQSMLNLARKGGGKIPASFMDFFNHLMFEATKISYVDAAIFVVVESSKDVVKATQAVGESLIFTGKIVNFLLPAILLIALYFFLNQKTDGQFSKALKGLKK